MHTMTVSNAHQAFSQLQRCKNQLTSVPVIMTLQWQLHHTQQTALALHCTQIVWLCPRHWSSLLLAADISDQAYLWLNVTFLGPGLTPSQTECPCCSHIIWTCLLHSCVQPPLVKDSLEMTEDPPLLAGLRKFSENIWWRL